MKASKRFERTNFLRPIGKEKNGCLNYGNVSWIKESLEKRMTASWEGFIKMYIVEIIFGRSSLLYFIRPESDINIYDFVN